MENLNINELLNIYFDKLECNNKYSDLFVLKIQPIFRQNIINFLNEFIYQISDNKYFKSYQKYFTNIKYKDLNQGKYRAFAITSFIKYINDSNTNYTSFRDIYKSTLQTKINGLTYDIYKIAYDSVYNYFYEYIKQYIYLNSLRKQIYHKLNYLANQLIEADTISEETLLNKYFNIYLDTKYLLIQYYAADCNDINGCTVLQSYKYLPDAIKYLDQRVEFEYKVNFTDIYYNNLIYSNNKLNMGLILSEQKFDYIINENIKYVINNEKGMI